MNISKNQREALQRACGTFPAEPMATFLDNLFPDELTAQQRALLINAATKLFAEHWTGATVMRSSYQITTPWSY